MAAGFQVINQQGVLQVDGTFKNMVLTAVGSATLSRPGGLGTVPYQAAAYARIPYPVSARQPVLALRSTNYVCFVTDDNGFTVFGPAGTVIAYYIFDRVEFGNAAGNAGVQVFNEQGAEVFNSNNRYMRVLGSYSVDIPVTDLNNTAPAPTYSGTVPSDKVVAVCMGVQSTGYWIVPIGTPTTPAVNIRYWQCQSYTPGTNQFILANAVIQTFGGPMTQPPSAEGSISPYNSGLLIDVTGI